MRWSSNTSFRGQVRRWVGAPGSLSAHLASAGQVFSVQVLYQGRQKLHPAEAHALGLPGRAPGYVREVMLRVDGVAVVCARSVTSYADSLGSWRAIRGLGARPLADILFKRIDIARTPLEFAKLNPASVLRRHVARAWKKSTDKSVAVRAFPARRSVFTRHCAPLLVMEIFAAEHVPWNWSRSNFTHPFIHLTQKSNHEN